METLPSQPRPRSLPVIFLDAVTRMLGAVRRPFRRGRPPTSQQIAIGIGAGIVLIGAAVLAVGVRWLPSEPTGAPHGAQPGAVAGTPMTEPTPGNGIPSPSGSETTPTVAGPDGSTPTFPDATTSGAATPSGTTEPERVGTGGRPDPLRARFSKVAGSESLTSYRATVTITNPRQVAVNSWTVTIILPRETLTLSNVGGATAARDSATWTIVPTAATASVAAGGSVSVSFQVNGAAVFDATPTACAIDGQACTGLDG